MSLRLRLRSDLRPSKPTPGFVGTPGFHPTKSTPGFVGTPGFHPAKPTPGFVGTPGLNPLSLYFSGLTGDRGWDEAIAKIANIRGFSGQVAPCSVVVLADQGPPSADYVGEREHAFVVEKAKQGK